MFNVSSCISYFFVFYKYIFSIAKHINIYILLNCTLRMNKSQQRILLTLSFSLSLSLLFFFLWLRDVDSKAKNEKKKIRRYKKEIINVKNAKKYINVFVVKTFNIVLFQLDCQKECEDLLLFFKDSFLDFVANISWII